MQSQAPLQNVEIIIINNFKPLLTQLVGFLEFVGWRNLLFRNPTPHLKPSSSTGPSTLIPSSQVKRKEGRLCLVTGDGHARRWGALVTLSPSRSQVSWLTRPQDMSP